LSWYIPVPDIFILYQLPVDNAEELAGSREVYLEFRLEFCAARESDRMEKTTINKQRMIMGNLVVMVDQK
jgi:hypothetical protein